MLGWSHLSVRRSVGAHGKWVTTTNRTGWPDWFGWHPRHGFAAIEAKVGRDGHDKRADDQRQVLAELEAAGARVVMAYPHDLDEVTAMLRGRVLDPPT